MNNLLFEKLRSAVYTGISIVLLLLQHQTSTAQHVTIPDANFISYLTNYYPSCMDGDDLDTTCEAVLEENYLDVSYQYIADLTGVQYFKTLEYLHCHVNELTSLPKLPVSLILLDCSFNYLTALPELPEDIAVLYASFNPITALPDLPDTWLYTIQCESCSLTSLPELPSTLRDFNFNNNVYLTCLPILPERLETTGSSMGFLNMIGTGITCVPNVPSSCFNGTSFPVCAEADVIDNPNECDVFHGIAGVAYHDSYVEDPWYTECEFNYSEWMHPNIRFLLLDDMDDTISIEYTVNEGRYHFTGVPDGEYTVVLDTSNVLYTWGCDFPGRDTLIEVIDNAVVNQVNFNIRCKDSYFDVGVDSAYTSNGDVAPGESHWLRLWAGEMPNSYSLGCTQGLEGEIEVIVEGPIVSITPESWCLTPTSVSGDTMRYTIADFSLVNATSDFIYLVEIDPLADEEDEICIKVTVDPMTGDADPLNNTFEFCYPAVEESFFAKNVMQVYMENPDPALAVIPYPNPTSGAFSFYLPQQLADAGANATIYNIAGEKVNEYFLTNEGLVTLDLSAENSGIYFMKIQSAEQIITCKLIKQ